MSCYNEETGSFILPSVAVMPMRRALMAAANEERTLGFACAQAVHEALQKDSGRMKELRQALKNGSAHGILYGLMDKLDPNPTHWSQASRKWDDSVRSLAQGMLLKYDQDTRTTKLRAPLKKEAKPVPTSTLTFQAGDSGSIHIDPKTRKVSWSVDRNNRAVEDARESRMGMAFFKALGAVVWTRGTGGHITATDEYAEDAARENGHYDSGSISTTLGPLGETHRADRMGMSVARMRKTFSRR